MLTIINLLIIFFIILIIYQIFLAHFSNSTIEGLENYKESDKNDPYNVSGLKQEIQDISGNVANLTKQVDDLVKAQEEYLAEKLPAEPPVITGADEVEEEPEAP